MKKYSCIILVLLAVATGCKKAAYLQYDHGARIEMADTTTQSFSFYYEAAAVTRDTVYVRLNTIGGITGQNRTVTVEQIPEVDWKYTYDPTTGKATDSSSTPRKYQAVAGKYFVPFTDPGMQALMFVQADSASTQLPIILLRDTSLKSNSYRLRIRIIANDAFALGEMNYLERTIQFSDRLERFDAWKVDSYLAPAYNTFGKYSTGKHQFMIDYLHTVIDQIWWNGIVTAGAQIHYNTLLREGLAAFNADPANIAYGKAPVREIPGDPNSAPISFP